MNLRKFYQDDHIAVVEKPAGVLVHPRPGSQERTFLDVLREEIDVTGRPTGGANLVHRLDRGTSGLMVVALSKAAARGLTSSFAAREVTKGYLALVFGRATGTFRVDAPLGKVLPPPAYWWVDPVNGLPSETNFEALWTTEDCSLLAVKPISGRTHQIRIHAAHKGHPIVGDGWYTKHFVPATPWQHYLFKNARRLCLHAFHISFAHPVHQARISFWCPPPQEFLEIARQLSSQRGETAAFGG